MPQSNTEKQARLRAFRGSTLPEPSDIKRVEREYGRLPRGASIEQRAYRWRLCVAEALHRLAYEDPVLDKILRRRRSRQGS